MTETLTLFGVSVEVFIALFFVLLLVGEFFFPLRKLVENKPRRVARNLLFSGFSGVVMRLLFLPVIFAISARTSASRWDFLAIAGVPRLLIVILLIVAMDYTLYFWHRMNHRIAFLWRFHNVHHVDLDLDASTAFRFHFGELTLSAGFRIVQVVLIGVDPMALAIYESLNLVFTQFHHSNLRLPKSLEDFLRRVLVTPRMHGIHHSVVRSETDSNYSTIFSWWDRVHRSFRKDVPQSEITIGVPSYSLQTDVQLWQLLIMPFQKARAWSYADGRVPSRKLLKQSIPLLRLALEPRAKTIIKIFGMIQFFFPDVPVAEALPLSSDLSDRGLRSTVIVDVRGESERMVSMIPGSISIGEFEAAGYSKSTKVVTYCTIGGRSAIFARKLRRRGYDAQNLQGSILLWAHLGLPIVNASGPTKTVHTFSKIWALLPRGWIAVW